MDIGRPLRELVAEPVVDPVPVDVPDDGSAAIPLTSVTALPSARDRYDPVGGPDDPGAASPALV